MYYDNNVLEEWQAWPTLEAKLLNHCRLSVVGRSESTVILKIFSFQLRTSDYPN